MADLMCVRAVSVKFIIFSVKFIIFSIKSIMLSNKSIVLALNRIALNRTFPVRRPDLALKTIEPLIQADDTVLVRVYYLEQIVHLVR